MPQAPVSSCLVRAAGAVFPYGVTWLTREGRPGRSRTDVMMDFGIQRIRRGDTVRTMTRKETLWVVRHLPGRPYQGFQFTPVHRWLLDPKQQGWQPAVTRAA